MTVRNTTILILGVTLAGLMAILYFSARYLLLDSFRHLEAVQVKRSIQRVQVILQNENDTLSRIVSDWAQWDDMYAFVQTRDPEFLKSNLVPSTYTGLHLSVFLILDTHSEVIYHGMLTDNGVVGDAPVFLRNYAQTSQTFATLRTVGDGLANPIALNDGLWLLAAEPILTSDGEGPSRGTVIIGRRIDAPLMTHLTTMTQLEFTLSPVGNRALPADSIRALKLLTLQQPIVVLPRNEHRIAGYTRLESLDAAGALLLRVEQPRSIYQQGLATIGYLLIWLLLVGLTVGLVMLLLLERTVLRRLVGLHQRVVEIGKAGDLSLRVTQDGRDEISQLGASVNDMLKALDTAQQEDQLREQALRESEERFRYLFAVEPDALILFDVVTLRHVEANDAALQMYGYTREEFLALRITDLTRDVEDTVDRIGEAELGEVYSLPLRYHVNKNGQVFPVELACTSFEVGDRRFMYLAVRDISDRIDAQERMNHLAYFDELTDLPNRLLFTDRLEQALARARRQQGQVALLFIDLDRFKEVNDSLGHAVGDELLYSVSRRLHDCARASDTVARMGGDEFVVILPDLEEDTNHPEALAQRIIDAFAEPFLLQDHELFISPSIGIAVAPDDGNSVDALMRHADLAMYRAKEQGRNRYQFFTADMSAVLSERRQLEGELRRALDNGEFTVIYQPQVDIHSRCMFGVEVLIRWQHPDLGIVSPLHFIPVAEETGLIEPIGEWVLQTACTQALAWHEAGTLNLRMAVNLSARQFERTSLVPTIERVLAETGLPPEALELEITESTAMRDWRRTASVLHQLRADGIHIAIDDFGTGHCSFGYLQHFPVTTLKMDRTFIQEIFANPTNPAIVHAIVVLSDALGLTLIAECVETREQLQMLLRQGVECFQGYLFSKPLAAEEIGHLLAKRRILLPDDLLVAASCREGEFV